MNINNHNMTKRFLILLAALVLTAMPAQGQAAGIAFVNKLDHPIIVQGSSVVNGMVQRSPQFVIYPGKVGFEANLVQGFRQITIYDANRPNVVLLRKTVNFLGQDMLFYIRPSINPNAQYPIDLFLPPPKVIGGS